MADSKTIQFDFGTVTFVRNPRSKYMRLKIHPEKGVIASLPIGYPEQRAIRFVQEKEQWIRKGLAKSVQIVQKNTVFEEGTVFKTRYHALQIGTHTMPSLKYEVKQHFIKIWYPESAQVEDPRIQKFIRHAIIETLRFEAKKHLPQLTHELAALWGLKCGNVSVRNNKTRWGSCSGQNNISLNIHLMRLPEELCNYVVYHELAHIKHKNHSERFWAYLEDICPGARDLDKKLNSYHLTYW